MSTSTSETLMADRGKNEAMASGEAWVPVPLYCGSDELAECESTSVCTVSSASSSSTAVIRTVLGDAQSDALEAEKATGSAGDSVTCPATEGVTDTLTSNLGREVRASV
jgi:hypothetical protein